MFRKFTVMQLLPALDVGGVERGTVEISAALVKAGHQAIVVSAGGKLVNELRELGAQHIEMPIGEKNILSVRHIKSLRELIAARQVDIVHARSRLPAWIGYRAIQGLNAARRPRWVTTVHGPYSVNFYSKIMTSGEKVIAISDFIRNYITQNYPTVRAERITVIARGIDRERYPYDYRPSDAWRLSWRSHYPQFEGRRLLVLPGRITRWKGHSEFISMIAELIKRGHAVHGLIAGGVSGQRVAYERELRNLVAEKGLHEHVTFLGNRDDLREVLASADIAYSLTLEPEAFGRTTIEALSLGVPVIGYDHGGTGEILREVLPGGLVPSNDISHAVETTCRFLQARIEVPKTHPFTLGKMQDETLAVYEGLYNAGPSR
ncbi:MAG: glycosyltransferase involved in cell wall biosynthesis [Gammaproteobacteria bacterium]|jgi:glycosyltransferase involved in cell wall biosynthesis